MSRLAGPLTIIALVVAQAVLWTVARPAGEPTSRYVGQLVGAESVLLLPIGLVLIRVARPRRSSATQRRLLLPRAGPATLRRRDPRDRRSPPVASHSRHRLATRRPPHAR